MQQAMLYIQENIKSKLNVDELAHRFGYSRWHFCEKFKSCTGKTVLAYIRHHRLSLAAAEILAGKGSTYVAQEYGYDTLGGFNKAFLTEFGCLPKEYRKKYLVSQAYRERRNSTMFKLSDRCEMLRDEVINKKEYINRFCAQRHVYFTLGASDCAGSGAKNAEIWARGTANVIESFTPFIAPGEIVVGNHYGDGAYHECFAPTPDDAGREIMRKNGISEEDIERYMRLRIEGGVDNGFRGVAVEPFTEAEKNSEHVEWAALGGCCDSNHSIVGLGQVVDLGFEGLLKKVEYYEAKNGESDLYRAMKVMCRAGCLIGEKYAEAAKHLLESGDPAYREEDLKHIIKVCSNVPRKGAETFEEAVQALFFAHVINAWEDQLNANSIGHLDRILYPYYKKDLESGRLTKEEAFEILCCLWIKLYRDYDVSQSCIGGLDVDGKNTENDLSYLMLDVTEQLNFIRCLSVRFSSKSDKKFIKRALEVVGHVQKGVPFFFNDDVMIPALVNGGIKYEDACDYTQIGCVETVIPGKSNSHAVTGVVNLLKALEYTFNNGYSMINPELRVGPETEPLERLRTYRSFVEELQKQIANLIELSCSKIKKCTEASRVNAPRPYKSLLTEGCMESGKDFNDGGALYDFYEVCLGGIPNLADSLAAIKKFVYDEKKYTITELKEILEQDFPDEQVRVEFMRKAPKYGNDIEEVDSIAAEMTDYACDVLEEMSKKYGMPFFAQPFTFLWMLEQGRLCAATPDGRHKGEIIAYSASPMQGRDFNGLTALLNSISCLPTKRTPGTTSSIVEIDPKLFTDSNLDTLTDLLLAAGEKGLSNVQFNTIDADTLIDAQKYPERYSNLAVRVSGFSQKFNLLSRPLQDHIIGRTKHEKL